MENTSQKINKDNIQSNNNASQNVNTKYENNKELLIKLLKDKLDIGLCRLEKRHKIHFSIMRSTTEEIKNITNWAISSNKQIKDKLKKDKDKQISQSKTSKSRKKELPSNSKSSFLKTKTPSRFKSKTFLFEDSKKDLSRNKIASKSFLSSKITKTMGNRTKSYSFINREKKRTNTNKEKNANNLNFVGGGNEVLRRPSIISNKSNKSNKTEGISKTPKNKKNNIKLNNKSDKNVTPVRKKTPFKKKTITEKSEKVINNIQNLTHSQSKENIIKSEIIKKKDENKSTNEINMNKMESALQKDDLLNNNDPLLISPITDLDFFPNGKISNSNTINSDIIELEKINKSNYNIQNIINEKVNILISDFLLINDLIEFKNISKYFYKLFKIYIIKKLEKDKEYFNKKKNNLDQKDIPQNLTIKDFSLSKGSIKAIGLLNEPHLNHIFFEEIPADNDRLIIYRIFFQLINHPYKNIPKDKKEEFWKKCQNYFSHEINGKTGDLIQKVIDGYLINIEGDNLYKIYKLAYKDLKKIYPSYYSKICGTTGLFTFIIKDILDFVGISNDQKIQSKAYWTYSKIIECIDNKINYIKNLKKI